MNAEERAKEKSAAIIRSWPADGPYVDMSIGSLLRAAAVTAACLLLTGGAGPSAAAPAAGRAPKPPRVIVVGWDGADWGLLDPLLREGKLPNLARLVARGRTYDLATFEPMASPLIWTTIATGRTPVDHGVADFQENDPKNRVLDSGHEPLAQGARDLERGLGARGLRVGVVGWWATWPAEKVNGFLVSDRVAPVLFDPESLSRSPALDVARRARGRSATRPEAARGVRPTTRSREGIAVTRAEFDAAVAAGKDLADPITGYRKILGVDARERHGSRIDLYDREKPRAPDGLLPGDGRDRPRPRPLPAAAASRRHRRGAAEVRRRASRRSTARPTGSSASSSPDGPTATGRRCFSSPITASAGATDRPTASRA